MRSALRKWTDVVRAADWANPAQMKKTYRSADIVGKQIVFNVGGNRSRVIALIHYVARHVLVQHVLTHPEYDKGDWKL